MSAKVLSGSMLVLGVASTFIGVALSQVENHYPSGPVLRLDEVPDIGSIELNTPVPIQVSITNRHPNQAFWILGVEEQCNKLGCVTWLDVAHEIRPGETRTTDFTWEARKAGPAQITFPLFTNAPGQTTIELRLQGNAVNGPSK